jgi:hypothetical protein
MITKSYTDISVEAFYEIFFQLLNVLQKDSNKLTKKQIKLLIEFLLLDDQVYKFNRFSQHGKREVQRVMLEKYKKKITTQSLHMFVILLKKKGIIYEDVDKVKYINKSLKTTLDSALKSNDPVEFLFKLKIMK